MAAEERFDGIHRREVVTDTWRRGYTATSPTFAECRAAIAFPLEGLHLERVRDTLADALPGLFKLGQAAGASDDRGNAGPPLLASRCDRRLSGIFPRGTVHELAGRAISSRRTPWKSSRR